MALYGLGLGLIFRATNAQIADAARLSERGTAFGNFYAFYSVGVILDAAASGLVASRGDVLDPFYLGATVAFSAVALLLLAGGLGAHVSPSS